jgi:hypothetical protein
MKQLSLAARAAFVLCVLSFATSTWAGERTSKVKLVNSSDWTLEEMYLSSVDDDEWGPDQLGHHVIKPGETFTLSNIPCGVWDVKLVDEDGDECVVESVEVCKSETWNVTSKDLLRCQAQ